MYHCLPVVEKIEEEFIELEGMLTWRSTNGKNSKFYNGVLGVINSWGWARAIVPKPSDAMRSILKF